jgi:OOP family OmpA-OmpF porin
MKIAMKQFIPLLAACGLCFAPSDGQADERVTVGGFGGAHIFSQNLELGAFDTTQSDSPRNAPAFGIRVGYALLERVRLEAELAIMPSKTRDSKDDLTVFGWRTHALVDLLPAARLRPFALVGVGFLTLAPTAPEILEEDTDLAAHLGLGVEYDMAATWSLRADARTVFAPTVTGDYLTTDFEFFFGAVKRFPDQMPPLPPDEDGDGVFAGDDKCPTEMEDQDGFDDEDGCPDPDNDLDGVKDEVDQCPAEAESKNGIDDEDGCPEPDGDGDGILGSQDKCPREAEDKDGVDDEDGCPDLDPVPAADPGPDAISPSAAQPKPFPTTAEEKPPAATTTPDTAPKIPTP